MKSGPRHAREKHPRRASALLRAGLTVSAAGAALAAAGGSAAAAEPSRAETPVGTFDTELLHTPVGSAEQALTVSTTEALRPLTALQLNPLANTGTDPLSNTAGTRIADFRPVSTAPLTGPLASGASLGELPVLQDVLPQVLDG